MNTTDEQFRATLTHALDDAADGIAPFDTAALVDAGARHVRGRRLATGAAAMVGVLALAGGSWAFLAQDRQPQVAAPQPTASVAAGRTAPVQATLDLSEGMTSGANPATEFTVTLLPDDTLVMAQVHDGTTTELQRLPLAGRSTIGWTPQYGDVLLGVVPVDAVGVALLESGNTGGYAGPKLADLPGTGLKAVGVRLDQQPEANPTLSLMWWRADGTPVTNVEVGTARRVEVSGEQVTAWALPQDGRGGLVHPDGASSTPLDNVDGGGLTVLTGGSFVDNQADGTYSSTHWFAAILPGTITDVEPQYDDPRLVEEAVTTVAWPEMGGTLVVGHAVLPPQPGGAVDGGPNGLVGMTWTDAAGVAQEWKA